MHFCLGLISFFVVLFAALKVNCQDFTYDGSLGTNNWGEQYNTCAGKHQSPINIDKLKVKKIRYLPLEFQGFDKFTHNASLLNNGHTVVVSLNFVETPTVSGGPLNATYKFSQFHFHWGDNDTFGSEDRIDNQSFPIELHMVLYNSVYDNFNQALNYANGIVVLAFFYNLSEEENKNYTEFTHLLKSIVEPHSQEQFSIPFKIKDLVSDNVSSYYTYIGSLTTPPCSEVVTWVDFAVPIPISKEQIKCFRQLRSRHGFLTHNIRPLQPLNDRTVYENDCSQLNTTVHDKNKTSSIAPHFSLAASMLIVTNIFKNTT